MENSVQFGELGSKLVQCGVTATKCWGVELLSEMKSVETLSKELRKKITGAKTLQQITCPKPLLFKWSLLCSTSYSVGAKAAVDKGLSKLCCTVISKVNLHILESRRKLLQWANAMNIYLSLWLHVNQWLSWNPSSLASLTFNYWDMVPDHIHFLFFNHHH